MTSLDTGVYGAKVQSWRRSNPRDLLKRLVDENRKASKEDIFKLFRDCVLDDPDYMDCLIEYWCANNYHSLIERRGGSVGKRSKRAMVEEIKNKVQVRIRREALFLLDTILPNGKSLRESTFGECAKIGGALSLIAAKGKPRQIVGKVLSDAQLRRCQAL